jgi:hypothetical protein
VKYESELVIYKATLAKQEASQPAQIAAPKAKGKAKKEKAAKDPNAPKRPLSPFFLFI